MDISGLVYRALNPVWARQPLSGAGAEKHGGRFNRRGVAALYLSLSPLTALREANQVGDLQPTTLVAYRARISGLFDATDAAALAAHGLAPADIADPGWRIAMLDKAAPRSQRLADQLIALRAPGLLAPSYARGAAAGERNLVLYRWNTGADDALSVIDDEGRLGPTD